MPIHMLGIKVRDRSDVGGEIDVGGLVGREFEHHCLRAVGGIERRDAHIAGQHHVDPGFFQHQMDEGCRCRFTLGARDRDDSAALAEMGAPDVEVGGDRNTCGAGHFENRLVERHAGAFDDGAEARDLVCLFGRDEAGALEFGHAVIGGHEQLDLGIGAAQERRCGTSLAASAVKKNRAINVHGEQPRFRCVLG